MMRKTIGRGVALASMFGFAFFGVPQQSEATTINAVTVSLAGITYTGTGGGGSVIVGWTFPVSLTGTQDLVLTQDLGGSTVGAYNFDLSDHGSLTNAVVTVQSDTTNFTNFTDSNGTLDWKGQDPGTSLTLNEALNYGVLLSGPGYQIQFGYADNLHSHTCGSDAAVVYGSNPTGAASCFPSPFATASNFQGRGGLLSTTLDTGNTGCSSTSGATCYDAAVIRIANISQVPEPATMVLLGTGVVGLVARRRRLKQNVQDKL